MTAAICIRGDLATRPCPNKGPQWLQPDGVILHPLMGIVVCGKGDYLILVLMTYWLNPAKKCWSQTMTMDFFLFLRVFLTEQQHIWNVIMLLVILFRWPRKFLLERFSPSIRANWFLLSTESLFQREVGKGRRGRINLYQQARRRLGVFVSLPALGCICVDNLFSVYLLIAPTYKVPGNTTQNTLHLLEGSGDFPELISLRSVSLSLPVWNAFTGCLRWTPQGAQYFALSNIESWGEGFLFSSLVSFDYLSRCQGWLPISPFLDSRPSAFSCGEAGGSG